jgi:hypothetical protein
VLRGLKVGTTEVWPVIVQSNGVIVDSAVHSLVEVQEEANAILAAIDSLDSARKAAGDDEIRTRRYWRACSTRCERRHDSAGPARKGEELDGLWRL